MEHSSDTLKRLFDILFSAAGLLFLSPLFVVVAVLIKLDDNGPVFFRQERVGRNFRPFRICKFRTMSVDAENTGPSVTVSGDRRITRIGKVLRRYKIDELPQLLNVLMGEMSFVGPRPEVLEYVQLFKSDYTNLLRVRPGITDPASIEYSNEEEILSATKDWKEAYITKILPEKIRISVRYLESHSISGDLKLIMRTLTKSLEMKSIKSLGVERRGR